MSQQPPFKPQTSWQEAAAQKRQTLRDSIPSHHLLPPALAARDDLLPSDPAILECGILNSLEIEITTLDDASELARRIASGSYTAVQVTEAFCKRASIAQQTIKCLTEILYDRALERARWLDEYQAREGGKTMGPLHGVPVSVKDTFNIKDVPSTMGLVSWIPYVSPVDSSIVKGILSAGGIIYVKTNTSQSCLMVETINNVFGTTRNPHNLSLSVGGSTGGEAGLLASGGSILGTGTDGGGSIRFPAAFCGLWGLKCSKNRLPTMGMAGPRSGNESVNAGLGPLGRSVASLELWMQAQLGGGCDGSAVAPWEYDSSCNPTPWSATKAQRPGRENKKLTIAVLRDDGVVYPTPPVSRALDMVIDLLRKSGHSVIDLPAERMKEVHRRAISCTMRSNVQDGGSTVLHHINVSGEPVVPRTATGSPETSLLTTHEVFANHLERAELSAMYNDLWVSFKMDAILAPAVAHPAPPHGKYVSNAYAAVYNMLDYVTGSVPVTTVDPELDAAPQEWCDREPYPRIEAERFPYDWGDKEMQELYGEGGPKIYKDSPVGVQFVCRRLQEEKMVGILKEVEALLG